MQLGLPNRSNKVGFWEYCHLLALCTGSTASSKDLTALRSQCYLFPDSSKFQYLLQAFWSNGFYFTRVQGKINNLQQIPPTNMVVMQLTPGFANSSEVGILCVAGQQLKDSLTS